MTVSSPAAAVPDAGSSTFGSLRIRNFRLFFGGQFVSQVGNWLRMVSQTLLVLELTGNGLAVGLLVACQFAPVLFLGPWAGLVADRSDKRRLLLIVQSLAMVQSFALAGLAFMDDPPLQAFYAVALAGGFAVAFDNPARRSFVVEMVPDELVSNAVSLNSALMTSARVFGPALAGLLAHTVGFGWSFTLDGLSYIAVLTALWRMDVTQLRPATPTPRSPGQVRAGLRYVRTVPELWIPLMMMAIVGTFSYNFQVVMPLFTVRTLGGDAGTFTLLFSVLSIGSMLGALLTARRRVVNLDHVIVAALLFGLSMALMAAMPGLLTAFPVAVLVGMSSVAFMTSSTALVQLRAGPSMRGRVLALQAMVFLGSTPIGGPLLGALCDALGARAGLLAGALAAFAAAGIGRRAAARRTAEVLSAELAA